MTLKFKVVLLALLLAVGVASCDSGQHQGAANKAPAKEATPAPAPAPAPEPAKPAPAPAPAPKQP